MGLITGTIAASGYSDLAFGLGTLYNCPTGWLQAGTSDWKKTIAQSGGNVPGRIVGDKALDEIQFTARFDIGATDGSTDAVSIGNALSDLIDRVRVDDWTFTVSYKRTEAATPLTFTWTCEVAAVTPDIGKMLLNGYMPVTLTVMRWPIPAAGPF